MSSSIDNMADDKLAPVHKISLKQQETGEKKPGKRRRGMTPLL
jgi:hypothetical protein